MNPTRLKVFQSIGYVVEPTCGVCTYGRFKAGSEFGTCDRFSLPIEGDGGDQEAVRHHVFGPGEKGAMRYDSLMIYKGGRCLDGFHGGVGLEEPWPELCRAGKVYQYCRACREALPHEHITDASAVYVLSRVVEDFEGLSGLKSRRPTFDIIDVCIRLETAQGIAASREGIKLTWTHHDSHGRCWIALTHDPMGRYVVDEVDVGDHLRWNVQL